MDNALEVILLLEKKIKNLLSNYEFLKKENEILLQNVSNLQNQVIDREQMLVKLKEEYDLLKVAKTISGSNTNTKDTKLKINALIREIDKCILELNQ